MSDPVVDRSGIIPTIYHYDEHTDELHVQRWQDVEPLLERNKRMRAAGFDGYNSDRSMRAFAEVPIAIFEQFEKEGVSLWNKNHWPEIVKRLKDPALAGFRLDLEGGMRDGILVKGAR